MPEHVQRGGQRSPPQPYSSCPNFRAEDSSTLESDSSFRGPSGRLLHTKSSLRSAVKRQESRGVQQTASKGYLVHRWGGTCCVCTCWCACWQAEGVPAVSCSRRVPAQQQSASAGPEFG